MTGRQRTTTSPSRTSSRRSTPCVDGCWGPILTVSSSRRSVAAIHAPRHGEVDRLGADRFRATQRMALPVIGQHDARQLGVAIEADAEQIEQLTLVPVGA